MSINNEQFIVVQLNFVDKWQIVNSYGITSFKQISHRYVFIEIREVHEVKANSFFNWHVKYCFIIFQKQQASDSVHYDKRMTKHLENCYSF